MAAGAGAVLAWVAFVLLISYGTGDLLHHETFGGFYDAQAQALRRGDLAVDPDAVRFEGFRMDDGTFVYQGLLPALVRVPVLAVRPGLDGRLTGVSMAVGAAVALAAAARVTLRTRRLVRGDGPAGAGEAVVVAATVFGLGGSSVLFLASKAWIYHEALLWGAAWSAVSLALVLDWITDPSHRVRWLLGAGVAAGAAVHSRLATGLGAVAALGLVAVAAGWGAVLRRRRAAGTADGAPDGAAAWLRVSGLSAVTPPARLGAAAGVAAVSVVLALGTYAAVNHARFGTLFSIPIDRQVLVGFDEQFQRALDANGGSLFGLRYSPAQLWQLLRPDGLSFRATFPYAAFPPARPSAVGGAVFAERDWSSSLPASAPLLAAGAVLGLVVAVAPRRVAGGVGAAAVRLPVLGSLVSVGGSAVIGYIAFRYQADLWPTLVLLAPLGVHAAARWTTGRRGAGRWFPATVVLLALWGGWVNASLAVEYQRVVAPGAWDGSRAAWLRVQDRLGPAPPVRRVGAVEALPPAGPRGEVLVVGDCEALYRSNGDLWYLLEGGQVTGSFRGHLEVVRVPTGAGLVLRGEGRRGVTELALEGRPDGAVRFVVASRATDGEEAAMVVGRWFRVRSGQRLALRTELDWRTGFAEVRSGDRELLSANVDLKPVPGLEPVDSGDLRPDVRVPDRSVCRSLAGGGRGTGGG
jgi:hypothetical protein